MSNIYKQIWKEVYSSMRKLDRFARTEGDGINQTIKVLGRTVSFESGDFDTGGVEVFPIGHKTGNYYRYLFFCDLNNSEGLYFKYRECVEEMRACRLKSERKGFRLP